MSSGFRPSNSKPDCQNETNWNHGATVDEHIFDTNCTDERLMKLILTYGSAMTGVYSGDLGFSRAENRVFDKCRWMSTDIASTIYY